ncbi:DUF6090 family protein [uncultured Algibacter sp.]|uniref:DUF6090 family protein n=1 Tax=uncultured Algibacter sp. TaxID=298659 RepID=UPI0026369FD1|nr:DUF6090 family protein [uncultured Algibacter sp.]
MENKTSKYFKYAIGEIILVVIGILIALQINNWNESRKHQEYEIQLLKQLKTDLKSNANDLKFNISLQNKTINSCHLLINHLDNKLPYNDSLRIHFANTGIWTKFIVNAGAYKTIESKGLDLITNLELRDLVFRIYEGNLNWLTQMEETAINQAENFRIRQAFKYFNKWNAISVTNKRYGDGTAEVIDYSKIIETNDFLYYLNSYMNINKIVLQVSEGYLDDNIQALTIIDNIINSKN